MPALTAAVVLVGAVCLLDLVLTLAVIRRLREHTTLLASRPAMPEPSLVGVGETVAFEATTATGEHVTSTADAGTTLVGVFSPECSACHERLPDFTRYAAGQSGGRERSLAVIVGTEEAATAQRGSLEPVARVVVEAPGGPVSSALKVQAFPTFVLLDASGTVLGSAVTPQELPVPAAV